MECPNFFRDRKILLQSFLQSSSSNESLSEILWIGIVLLNNSALYGSMNHENAISLYGFHQGDMTNVFLRNFSSRKKEQIAWLNILEFYVVAIGYLRSTAMRQVHPELCVAMANETTAIERLARLGSVSILGSQITWSKMQQTVYCPLLVWGSIRLCKRRACAYQQENREYKARHTWLSYEAALCASKNCE